MCVVVAATTAVCGLDHLVVGVDAVGLDEGLRAGLLLPASGVRWTVTGHAGTPTRNLVGAPASDGVAVNRAQRS
jgi:hypothetical protein